MLKTAFFNKKDAISRLRPRDKKNVNAGVASLERIWSLAERSIPFVCDCKQGAKGAQGCEAKQNSCFVSLGVVSEPLYTLKILILIVS